MNYFREENTLAYLCFIRIDSAKDIETIDNEYN